MVIVSEFKSEDPGFDLMAGHHGEEQFCCSPNQLLCRLNEFYVWTVLTQICARVKYPISICRKRAGLVDNVVKATGDGGRSSLVSASKFKSEVSGFDPLVGQGEGQFFYHSESSLVQPPRWPCG